MGRWAAVRGHSSPASKNTPGRFRNRHVSSASLLYWINLRFAIRRLPTIPPWRFTLPQVLLAERNCGRDLICFRRFRKLAVRHLSLPKFYFYFYFVLFAMSSIDHAIDHTIYLFYFSFPSLAYITTLADRKVPILFFLDILSGKVWHVLVSCFIYSFWTSCQFLGLVATSDIFYIFSLLPLPTR